jgi:hypothetical protein
MKNQSYKLSVDPHVDPHAAAHVCCAERPSAYARANLSSIEILWYLGKNCTSAGTVHIISSLLEYPFRTSACFFKSKRLLFFVVQVLYEIAGVGTMRQLAS